jgi:hypothetical protein
MTLTHEPPPAPPGTCWYCGRAPGGIHSTAFPFAAHADGRIRVLVLPRCDGCQAFHARQEWPAGLIVVGCAAAPAILLSMLPLPPAARGPIIMGSILAGAGTGIYLVASRDQRAAARAGTRSSADFVTDPRYRALAGDTATWYSYPRTTARPEGSAPPKRDSVLDYQRFFAGDPRALEALREGCREAGVPAPD